MNKKSENMAAFYSQCKSKGYCDMSNQTHLLKAKVIATDLKLKYPKDEKMQDFMLEAEKCYQTRQREIQEEKEKQKREYDKIKAENARRAVDGELLLTIFKTNSSEIKIYRRPDKSVYHQIDKSTNKIEGSPKITIERSIVNTYLYHPSQTVYTGATVGGITTGGFHETGASLSTASSHSGKGYLSCNGEISKIEVSEAVAHAFKRSTEYRTIVKGRVIECRNEGTNVYDWAVSGAIKSGNAIDMLNAATFSADEKRLYYNSCVKIANVISKIITGNYPESDESMYERALELSKSDKTEAVQKAYDLLNTISDYKDSSAKKSGVKKRLDELIQMDKEKKLLDKEARKKKTIKHIVISIPVLCVCVAVFIVLNIIIQSNNKNKAYELYGGTLNNAKVGDVIKYGTYEQDGDLKNGMEEIEWIVLAKEDRRILVISDKALDCQPYNKSENNVTWKTSSIRKWTNGMFLSNAFSSVENSIIVKSVVSADNNPEYDTHPGKTTKDKVFLLSVNEVNKYFR